MKKIIPNIMVLLFLMYFLVNMIFLMPGNARADLQAKYSFKFIANDVWRCCSDGDTGHCAPKSMHTWW